MAKRISVKGKKGKTIKPETNPAEIFKRVREQNRNDEMKEHNGKSFTSPNLETPKTKYTRKEKHKGLEYD